MEPSQALQLLACRQRMQALPQLGTVVQTAREELPLLELQSRFDTAVEQEVCCAMSSRSAATTAELELKRPIQRSMQPWSLPIWLPCNLYGAMDRMYSAYILPQTALLAEKT